MRRKFRGRVRYFRPEAASGLAVVDIPAGGGVLALGVSKKLLDASGLKVGDSAEVEIQRL